LAGQSVPMAAQAPHLPSQQYSPLLHDFDPHDIAVGGAESTVATDASPASTLLAPPWFVADGNGFDESSPPQAASTNTNPNTSVRIVLPSV
jgi:hypothetical protein